MKRSRASTALDIAFPSQVVVIAQLRLEDATFDEICADFVAIAELIATADPTDALQDMHESLAGLKRDIEDALRCAEGQRP